MKSIGLIAALVLVAGATAAQDAGPAPYGAPITLEQAKRVAAAAEAEAQRNKWAVAIAVVEPSGALVHFVKLDGANYSAVEGAQDKARSAALFRLPTRIWDEQASRPGGAWVLGLRGAVPLEGGAPIVVGGRTIGAVGVSGVSSGDDGRVALAGAAAAAR